MPLVGLGQSPPSPLSLHFPTSPPTTLCFSIFYYSLFPLLTHFIYFLAFSFFPWGCTCSELEQEQANPVYPGNDHTWVYARYRLWGCNTPRFVCRLLSYITHLLTYLLSDLLPYLFTYFLTYSLLKNRPVPFSGRRS